MAFRVTTTKGRDTYKCEICKVTCTSAFSLNCHFKGKKHQATESVRLKNLKASPKPPPPFVSEAAPKNPPPFVSGIEYVRRQHNAFSKCELCGVQFVDVMAHVNCRKHILKYMETHHPETFKKVKGQGLKCFHPEDLKSILADAENKFGKRNINIYAEDALWMGEMFNNDEKRSGPHKKLQSKNCLKNVTSGNKPPMANTTCNKSMTSSKKVTDIVQPQNDRGGTKSCTNPVPASSTSILSGASIGKVTGKEDEPPKKKQRADINSDKVGESDLKKDAATTTAKPTEVSQPQSSIKQKHSSPSPVAACSVPASLSSRSTAETKHIKEKCYKKEGDRRKAMNCDSEPRNQALCSSEVSSLKEPESQQADSTNIENLEPQHFVTFGSADHKDAGTSHSPCKEHVTIPPESGSSHEIPSAGASSPNYNHVLELMAAITKLISEPTATNQDPKKQELESQPSVSTSGSKPNVNHQPSMSGPARKELDTDFSEGLQKTSSKCATRRTDPRIGFGSRRQCSITQTTASRSVMNQNLDSVKRDLDTISSRRPQTSPSGCATRPTDPRLGPRSGQQCSISQPSTSPSALSPNPDHPLAPIKKDLDTISSDTLYTFPSKCATHLADPRIKSSCGQQCSITQPSKQNQDHTLAPVKKDLNIVSSDTLQMSPSACATRSADLRIGSISSHHGSLTQPSASHSALKPSLDHSLQPVRNDFHTIASDALQTSPSGSATHLTDLRTSSSSNVASCSLETIKREPDTVSLHPPQMPPSRCLTSPTESSPAGSVPRRPSPEKLLEDNTYSSTSQSSLVSCVLEPNQDGKVSTPSLLMRSEKKEPGISSDLRVQLPSVYADTKTVSKEKPTSSSPATCGRLDTHCKDINQGKLNKAPATSSVSVLNEDKDFSKLPFNSYSSVRMKRSPCLSPGSQRSPSQRTPLQASSQSNAKTDIQNSSKSAGDMKITALKQIFKEHAVNASPIRSIHDTIPKASTITSVSQPDQVLQLQKKVSATLHAKDLASSDTVPVSPLGCATSSAYCSSKLAASLGGKNDIALSKIIAEATKAAAEKPVLKGIDINRVVRILMENGGMKSVKSRSHK